MSPPAPFEYRFIPAGAGNTGVTCTPVPAGTVYPRWRGEHISGTISPIYKTGLSPLARGTPPARLFAALRVRFIPAGAGNTFPFLVAESASPVYPRWRGEHDHALVSAALNLGLSPLARGTPAQTEARKRELRFIPAGAGNTAAALTAFPVFPVYPRWRGEHPKS